MNAKARKTEINLRTLGTGVIFLGAWSFIKFALTFLIYGNEIYDDIPDSFIIWINVIIWVFAGIDFLISFYIGISAHSESKGKRKRIFYLILTGILVFFEIILVFFDFLAIYAAGDALFTMIVTTIIDLTSLIILIELMVNAIRLRRLRKKEATA